MKSARPTRSDHGSSTFDSTHRLLLVNSFSIVVESKPSAIVDVHKQIISDLEKSGFGKSDIFAVHLAVEEAFINAVKHGNKMDPSKKVEVKYSVNSDKIEIIVADEGNGFEPKSVADPRFGSSLNKTSGRGLLLMKSFMDAVKYNERGNSVYMVRYKEKRIYQKTKDEQH